MIAHEIPMEEMFVLVSRALLKRGEKVSIKILHVALEAEYDLTGISVDLSRKTGVLIRQSRKKSDKNHYESRLRQETMLSVAAEIRGDEDDRNILLYDEGAGISGTKGYDERPKLSN